MNEEHSERYDVSFYVRNLTMYQDEKYRVYEK